MVNQELTYKTVPQFCCKIQIFRAEIFARNISDSVVIKRVQRGKDNKTVIKLIMPRKF